MNIKKLTIVAAVTSLAVANCAQGQLATNVTSTTVNLLIPDGNPAGLSSQTSLSSISGIISSVTVNLDITGGFNGDLYAYLSGPAGGFAVLLNRSGVTSGNSFGYGNTGFNITLSDSSPNNIHSYQLDTPSFDGTTGQLLGTWAPDGRNINPLSSGSTFDSTSPTADLSSFDSISPDGTWTLFVADLSSGGQGTLVSWGLTVVTVPEPQTWIMVAGGLGVLVAFNRRRKI